MANETEFRWRSGKEEYTVSEIEYMLQSQRAMIYNDVNKMLHHTRTGTEEVIIEYLKDPRKLEI